MPEAAVGGTGDEVVAVCPRYENDEGAEVDAIASGLERVGWIGKPNGLSLGVGSVLGAAELSLARAAGVAAGRGGVTAICGS